VVAVGALAATGSVATSNALVLRIAPVGAILVAAGLLVLLRRREREHARALAEQTSARRREQSLFQGELDALRDNLAALTAHLAQLAADAESLRMQIGSLREEKAEAEELVRRLRAARADRPAAGYLPLTPAAYEAAAAVLDALSGPADEEDALAGLAGYLSGVLGGDPGSLDQPDQVIDLTPHDDTLPISLAVVRGA